MTHFCCVAPWEVLRPPIQMGALLTIPPFSITMGVQPNRKQVSNKEVRFNSAEWSSDRHSSRKGEVRMSFFSSCSFFSTFFCLVSIYSQPPILPSGWVTSPGPILWYFHGHFCFCSISLEEEDLVIGVSRKQSWIHSGSILDL